ncbi:MAG TPA: S8 family serine peptidase [Thermoleophilaceae bacterium]|jgi:subtilisin family serine protease
MPKKKPYPKVQPKLRMIANATMEVCAIRAEHSAASAVPKQTAREFGPKRAQGATPDKARRAAPRTKRLHNRLANVQVSVFFQIAEDPDSRTKAEKALGIRSDSKQAKSNLRTVETTAQRALELSNEPWALGVELGQPLTKPTPKVETTGATAPTTTVRRFGKARDHHYGEDVLIGLIDVGGFDFTHEDFLGPDGKTRFECIWDQGGDLHDPPADFGYGSVITKADMDRAIAHGKKPGNPPAHLLEPQSQMQPGSHGTHVASIAAGNRGVARKASIAAVLISLPEADEERRTSFYDSSRLAHAMDWLLDVAGSRPVSVNISLGTNGHAHDDSSAINRWIDAALTVPGRSVCVAAGNAGQDRAEFEGDIGFILGRIHASGQIAARELVHDIEWNVVGNASTADISENELEIWYEPGDRLAVQVKPPGLPWTEAIEPGEYIENRRLPDRSFLSVYNELYNASNGDNYIGIYLSPQLREQELIGVRPGQWLVRLIGREVRGGRFDCWIERDDPRKIGRIGEREAWVYPSFFSENSYVDSSTVSTLACGQRIVSVANLDVEGRRINPSSSQGPTRDDRRKPDIAAPGTKILAARGFEQDPRKQWMAMTGTSMASPHVAGVVGLMLAANRTLTGAQVSGIIQRTAAPLPGADFAWRNDAGSGRLAEERCVEEARVASARHDRTKVES